MSRQFTDASKTSLDRWADMALARMTASISRWLGMDLLADGSVQVHGLDESRATVGMIAPFGPIAHHLQVLRTDAPALLRFYQVYCHSVDRLGRRSQSFDGQVDAFMQAVDAVDLPRPELKAVA